ncbi:APC family permease [candidate division KSB1 bacterium]
MKLSKSVGLWDVVLMNVTAIIGLRWISLAAAGGNTSITLWFAAVFVFFLPQAFAVIELTTRYPEEGGIYVWTKKAFGDMHGFISGWCYWTNNLVYFPNLLVYIAGISVFTAGGAYQELGENKLYVILFSLAVLWSVMFFNYIGLKFGRWINNIGGIGTWITGGILIVLGIVAVIRYGLANPMPPGSFFSELIDFEKLTFFTSICFGFTGLELASIIAGEVKDPRRSIPRAVLISGIIIGAIYIAGTFAVLVALPLAEINIITGFLQGIAAIANKLGLGWISNILALLITLGGIGGTMAWFTGAARIPFVAGIDQYLPKKFGAVHPKHGSPHIAIIVQAVIATLFILMSFIGSSVEEAYLILFDTTVLVYFIPYLYMFSAYMVLRKRNGSGEGIITLPSNNSAAFVFGTAGFLTTLIAMIVVLFPPSDTSNALVYEAKVIGGFLIFVVSGVVIYLRGKRK